MQTQSIRKRLDHIGIGVSLLCAIHCSLLPLLATSLPLWGLSFLTNEYIEIMIIVASFFIGCYSLIGSYKKTRSKKGLLILTAGFIFILSARFLVEERFEWMFMVAGGLCIAAAHYINWRILHSLPHNNAAHKSEHL